MTYHSLGDDLQRLLEDYKVLIYGRYQIYGPNQLADPPYELPDGTETMSCDEALTKHHEYFLTHRPVPIATPSAEETLQLLEAICKKFDARASLENDRYGRR
jgi:hypothetical protein